MSILCLLELSNGLNSTITALRRLQTLNLIKLGLGQTEVELLHCGKTPFKDPVDRRFAVSDTKWHGIIGMGFFMRLNKGRPGVGDWAGAGGGESKVGS